MKIKSRSKFESIYSKEEFIKKILFKFAKEEDVSPDLIKAEFGEVKIIDKEFFYVSGETTCDYTCSIGYNRTETYVEMETKREKVGDTWRDVSRPVNKTRTVTDWQPYSGTANGNFFTIVNSEGKRDQEAELCESFFKKVENGDLPVDGDLDNVVKDGATKELEVGVETRAIFSLPGDTYKQFLANNTVAIKEAISLIIPYYQVAYTYKGDKKTLEFCSCADFNISLSDNERKKLNYTPLDTKKAAEEEKDVKILTKIRNISWVVGIVLSGLLMMVPMVGFLLSILAIAVPIKFTFKRSKKFISVKKELDVREQKKKENIINERRKETFAILKEVYKDKGFEEITFEELYN